MLGLGILLVFLYLFYRKYLVPPPGPVPLVPGHLPIVGILPKWVFSKDLFQAYVLNVETFTVNNGGVSKTWIPFIKPVYTITDVEEAKFFCNQFLDKMFTYKMFKTLFGSEMLAADESVWKINKRMLDQAFKQNILSGYIDIFNEEMAQFVNGLPDRVNEEADFNHLIKFTIMKTSCRTIFGKAIDEEDILRKYIQAFKTIVETFALRTKHIWLSNNFLYSLSKLKHSTDKAIAVVDDITNQIVISKKSEHIERLKKKVNAEGPKFRSTLDIILENVVTEDSCSYSVERLKHLILNALFAATDTTSVTTQIMLTCIGTHPTVQERIYEEIMEVVGEHDVTTEHLSKLVYLEAAIKEAIRLYPVGPIIGRRTSRVTKLRNETVPAGSSILINLWAISRNKKYWGDDALEYNPERWLDQTRQQSNVAAFASFSLGKRNCVGKLYAMVSLKILAVHVIRKFRIQGDHSKLKFSFNAVSQIVAGHLLKFEERQAF